LQLTQPKFRQMPRNYDQRKPNLDTIHNGKFVMINDLVWVIARDKFGLSPGGLPKDILTRFTIPHCLHCTLVQPSVGLSKMPK